MVSGGGVLQVPQLETLLLEGFLLLEQGLVERWWVTPPEGGRRLEEMQDPLAAQGEERWRARVDFCLQV